MYPQQNYVVWPLLMFSAERFWVPETTPSNITLSSWHNVRLNMASNKTPFLSPVLYFYSSTQVINISVMHEIIYLRATALATISVLFEWCKFNERKFSEPTNYSKLFLTTQFIRDHGNIQQIHACFILIPIMYISMPPRSDKFVKG